MKLITIGFENSNCISCLFCFGIDEVGIQKMRSIFFERGKSSSVAVTQPAGWGGVRDEFKIGDLLQNL